MWLVGRRLESPAVAHQHLGLLKKIEFYGFSNNTNSHGSRPGLPQEQKRQLLTGQHRPKVHVDSGLLQSTVLGLLMFLLNINNIGLTK